mmetsp:Transcript_10179/g.23940  ORF Transcript_10179/g.23940 Transcript_10179/m.23940 type:complete len:124 (-) Transcript_10179:152-523(-)
MAVATCQLIALVVSMRPDQHPAPFSLFTNLDDVWQFRWFHGRFCAPAHPRNSCNRLNPSTVEQGLHPIINRGLKLPTLAPTAEGQGGLDERYLDDAMFTRQERNQMFETGNSRTSASSTRRCE